MEDNLLIGSNPEMFEIYSVYWRNQSNHVMMHSCTAISKEDAIVDFKIKVSQSIVKKITKVVKGYGMPKTTPKQMLSHQYRSCIGALKMAEKNLQNINTTEPDAHKYYKLISIRGGAIKHIQNAMRDTKDLFTRLGLKIK